MEENKSEEARNYFIRNYIVIIRKIIKYFLIISLFSYPVLSEERIRMAVTTSIENSGLLYEILPPFEDKFNVKVDVIAVGTGRALKLGENGDVDIVFIHHRKSEDKFVKEGFGVNRCDVMFNDFVIIGHRDDPAGIKGDNCIEALKKIKDNGCFFISRGDKSGTNNKEIELWAISGIELSGKWYLETGQGMGATIQLADEKKAYCLADRGTYIAYEKKIDIVILCEGDMRLLNPYGIIAVNPDRHPHVKYNHSIALIEWLTSIEEQKMIGEFKKNGKVLFYPNAVNDDNKKIATEGTEGK